MVTACGGGSHWRAGHDVTMSRVTGYDGPTLTLPTAALISLTPAAVRTLQTVPSHSYLTENTAWSKLGRGKVNRNIFIFISIEI